MKNVTRHCDAVPVIGMPGNLAFVQWTERASPRADSKQMKWADDFGTDAKSEAENRQRISHRIFQRQMMRMAGNSIDDGYPKRRHHADAESALIHHCTHGGAIAAGPTKSSAIGPRISITSPTDDKLSLIMFHEAPTLCRRVSF